MDDTKRTAVATDLYASGEYLDRVADWHVSESSGKVQYLLPLLRKHNLVPRSVVDIGCGVGEVLRLMQPALPEGAELVGYDIAPEALKLAASRANDHLRFREGALPDPAEHYDLLLALDVIEHLEDYFTFLRALRGEVVTGPEADVRLRALDGRELEVNISAAPLRDREPDGRIVGAVSVLRDVTWRTQLEREREAAREQAERDAEQLDRIFEAVADGLLVYDAQGRTVRENPASRRIFGLDAALPGFRQLPLRERLARYAPRDEQGRPVAVEELLIMRALRGEAEAELGSGQEARDIRMRALDGREIELHIAAAPLRDGAGHLVGAVSVLHDLTERNRLAREREDARANELAARETSRRLEAFLATAAHDLRSPPTAVIGYLDLAEHTFDKLAAVLREASPPALAPRVAGVHHDLEEAGKSAARLTRLLTLLFDTAAARADQLELHRAPFDLAALVREQVAALRVAAPDSDDRPADAG